MSKRTYEAMDELAVCMDWNDDFDPYQQIADLEM